MRILEVRSGPWSPINSFYVCLVEDYVSNQCTNNISLRSRTPCKNRFSPRNARNTCSTVFSFMNWCESFLAHYGHICQTSTRGLQCNQIISKHSQILLCEASWPPSYSCSTRMLAIYRARELYLTYIIEPEVRLWVSLLKRRGVSPYGRQIKKAR